MDIFKGLLLAICLGFILLMFFVGLGAIQYANESYEKASQPHVEEQAK